jgi:predicted Zn-dependent protease
VSESEALGGTASGPAAVAAAERVLAIAGREAGAAEAEVTVTLGVSALTRFANSRIHQNMDGSVSRVALRMALDGRVASASLDGPLTEERLERLVREVVEAARVVPVDADWPGLTPPSVVPSIDPWDDETAAATPADRAERVAAFVRAASGLEAAGSFETEAIHQAFANSAGQSVAGRMTSASLDGVARTGTSDGAGRSASIRLAEVDGASAGETAAAKARSTADATDLEPGTYEVILEPQAVADVLSFYGLYGFNARAVGDGTSFVRVGETQFDTAVTLRDDSTDPRLPGFGFDAEGTPRAVVDLVRDGVTSGVLQSRRTARKAGEGIGSTGHASLSPWVQGAIPAALVMEPGSCSVDELVAGVGRGLLVTDVFYTRVLDPRTVVVTGLTRNGVWLIEDGRIVRPVRNLRFTQSYVAALGPGQVRGITRERWLVPDGWGGFALVPQLHLAAWRFSGGAKG